MEATITSKGQITIPKKLRDRFNLEEGTKITFMVEENEIIMMPEEDPLERLKRLRKKIKFSEKDLQEMIAESKKAWS